MDTDAHTLVDEWEVGSFDGGLEGIHGLRSRRFSGAVEAAGTVLFLREGEPVAVVADLEGDPRPGDLDAFEGASGTRHEAPHPGSVTLAAMLALGGEVKGRYFTDDTPLRTVHETLVDGGFTGYVELAENVMSGDYYVVYVDGEADHLAYIGRRRDLHTGEEARTRAEGEVGIFAVVSVGLPTVELPETAGQSGGSTGGSVAGGVDLELPDDAGDGPATGGDAAAGDGATAGDDPSGAVPPGDGTATTEVTEATDATEATDTGATAETQAGDDADPSDDVPSEFEIDLDLGPDGDDDSEPDDGAPDEGDPEHAPSDPNGQDTDGRSGPESASESPAPPEDGSRMAGDQEAATGDGEDTDDADPTADEDVADRRDDGDDADVAEIADDGDDGADTVVREAEPSADTAATTEPGTQGDEVASEHPAGSAAGATNSSPGDSGQATASSRSGGGGDRDAMEDVTTRSIPSLDPQRSRDPDVRPTSAPPDRSTQPDATGGAGRGRQPPSSAGQSSSGRGPDETAARGQATGGGRQTGGPRDAGAAREPVERRRETGGGPDPDPETGGDAAALREEYEGRIRALQEEVESLHEERDRLRDERDRLRKRVAALESQGGAAGAGSSAGAGGGAMSPAEALAGTSLFVRESTRGEATLEDAHAGRVDRESLAENLHLEYHTTFEDEGTTVDGQPYDEWLHASPAYAFVDWFVADLLFEIRSTGAAESMRPLYDALPAVDRIAFEDVVSVDLETDEGVERREMTFDVVARDQMGDPLVVANVDGGREPTDQGPLETLITDATDVGEGHETLAGAFAVTSSYFEPDALALAREATSSSLLSREKFRSYVKLSRKNGYHLCLVESRADSFHLAIPEL